MKKRRKVSLWLLGLFVLFVILYNAFYLIFKFEEPIFFFLSVLAALAFVGSVFYDIIIFFEKMIELNKRLRSKFKSIKRKR